MKGTLMILTLAAFVAGCAPHRESAAGRSASGSEAAFGSASQRIAPQDSSFAAEACQAGATELEIGKLAERNTKNKAVRALARKLAEDHAKAEQELAKLFVKKEIPPVQELSPSFQSSLDRLGSLKGREFDQAFKQQVIEDHEKAIQLFEKQAEEGTDPDLRAFAENHLSHLRQHLAMAQRLNVNREVSTNPDPGAIDPILNNPASRGINVPR